MIFRETRLRGAFVVELEERSDPRGFFARSFCREEFAMHGLENDWLQSNISVSKRRGTLRGMHWQNGRHAEAKLVRCTAGALFDVIVDLRPDSPTLGEWYGLELTASKRDALYVPRGFAHGFLTLSDRTEVFYEMSAVYAPEASSGFRWDDPRISIEWPAKPRCLSERDEAYSPLPDELVELASRGHT